MTCVGDIEVQKITVSITDDVASSTVLIQDLSSMATHATVGDNPYTIHGSFTVNTTAAGMPISLEGIVSSTSTSSMQVPGLRRTTTEEASGCKRCLINRDARTVGLSLGCHD